MIKINNTFHSEETENSIFNPETLNSNISNYDNMFKDKLNFPFDKTKFQIYENINDIIIDNESKSKISNPMNIAKLFSFEKKLIDIEEDKEIKKESTFFSQNDYSNFESNITIDDNPINQNFFDDKFENISNNNFEEKFLTNYYEIESNLDNNKLFFVPYKKENNSQINKNKKEIFSIHKEKNYEKKNNYFNITNEKTEDKNENDNICILINDSKNDEKTETNFIGKKRNRNIFRVNFQIFNPREYDDYSKRMIHEVVHVKNNDNINLGNLFVIKFKRTKHNNRKNYSDDIRKKIKSGFHKILKNILNAKLEIAGSKLFFEYLPQVFITNISKKENKNILNLTLEEILSKNFCLGKDVKSSSIMVKYYHNLKVLKYLENNKEISQKVNFNNIKDMKYYEVFNEYLNSKEFEEEILRLHKKENDIYIRNYISKAMNLIDFFNN